MKGGSYKLSEGSQASCFSQAQCAEQAHQNRIRDAEMKNNLNHQVGGEKIEVKMADCGGSASCEQNAKLTASTTLQGQADSKYDHCAGMTQEQCMGGSMNGGRKKKGRKKSKRKSKKKTRKYKKHSKKSKKSKKKTKRRRRSKKRSNRRRKKR